MLRRALPLLIATLTVVSLVNLGGCGAFEIVPAATSNDAGDDDADAVAETVGTAAGVVADTVAPGTGSLVRPAIIGAISLLTGGGVVVAGKRIRRKKPNAPRKQ